MSRRPTSLSDEANEETTLNGDRIDANQSATTFVYVLTFFSGLGGLLFGYDTGVISGAMILMRTEFSLSSLWQELIVGVTVGSAAVFALLAGYLNNGFGRRPVILSASAIFTVGAILLASSTSKYMLLVGRTIIGMGLGLTSMSIPVYIAEMAPTHCRGRLVSTHVAMIAFGQLLANIVGGLFSRDTKHGWRYMLGLAAGPSVIQFIGFLFLQESPRWLLSHGLEDKARRVLQNVRGRLDVKQEFSQIQQTSGEEQYRGQGCVLWKILWMPSVLRALVVGCGLQMIQQLVGINTIMYYTAIIIRMAGVKNESLAIWLSVLTAAVNFFFTLIGLFLVEKIGRRSLTLGSLAGTVLGLVCLAISFQVTSTNSYPITHPATNDSRHCSRYRSCYSCITDINCGACYRDNHNIPTNMTCVSTLYDNPVVSLDGPCLQKSRPDHLTWAYDFCPSPFAWLPVVGLMVYLMFFAPGMGPMPWTVNSEIYPLWARSTGNAVATFTNWSTNLFISMTFLTFTEELTRSGTFWLYAGFGSLGLLLVYFFLPETKDKSLEEVEGLFAQPLWCGKSDSPITSYYEKSVQYVHIKGLNRDGRDSDQDSPE